MLEKMPESPGEIDGHPISPCVRSGYCCKKATCTVGLAHGADPHGSCEFLRGDEPGDHSCGLLDDGIISKEHIHAGEGCCASLCNTARDKVIERLKKMSTPEEERRTCTRCDEEEPDEDAWNGNEDPYDGDIFCDSCVRDQDKSGSPYKSDHLEMIDNPRSYLPHGH